MKYRNSIEIISSILRIVLTPEATRTKIMYRARLSYNQTVGYLNMLLSRGLISIDESTGFYIATEKGLHLLRKSDELIALITKEPVSEDPFAQARLENKIVQ